MKHYTSQKTGFTLLELLITASLFVVIAGLTVSIFTGVSKLQVTRKGSQALAGQLRQAEAQFSDDFQNSQAYTSADPTVVILNTAGGSSNSVLAIRRNVVDASGNTDTEWRLYCLSNNELFRFRLPYTQTSAAPSLLAGVTSVSCPVAINGVPPNGTALESLFSNSGYTWGTIPAADEITDAQSTVQDLLFTQVQPNVSQTDPTFTALFNNLRVEMSAQDSVNDPAGAPIVLRIDLNRLSQ